MERSRGDFEAQADEHQPHGEIGQRGLLRMQDIRDVVDVGGSGGAVDHGHAVEEERGGERAEQKILQRRLGAFRGAAAHAGKNVGRDRRNLQRDEDQHQLDGGRHQHHADGAEENQSVILAAGTDALHIEVIKRGEDDDQRNHQHDHMEEHAEGVNPDHVVKAFAVEARLVGSRSQRGEYADQSPRCPAASSNSVREEPGPPS